MSDEITVTFNKSDIYTYILTAFLACNPLALTIGVFAGFGVPSIMSFINIIGTALFGIYVVRCYNLLFPETEEEENE